MAITNHIACDDLAKPERILAIAVKYHRLSLDNLFAFYLVFKYFKVPLGSQNRVLQWGVVGAIVMRALMVGAGALVVSKFHKVLLLFAVILLYVGKISTHLRQSFNHRSLWSSLSAKLTERFRDCIIFLPSG
jgi:tellurite resistance protein TerC